MAAFGLLYYLPDGSSGILFGVTTPATAWGGPVTLAYLDRLPGT